MKLFKKKWNYFKKENYSKKNEKKMKLFKKNEKNEIIQKKMSLPLIQINGKCDVPIQIISLIENFRCCFLNSLYVIEFL